MPIGGNQILIVPMPEIDPRPNRRLGRHQELDGRSLAYAATSSDLASTHVKPIEHVSPISTLDQGNLGSCVGNASTYHFAQVAKDALGASAFISIEIGGVALSRTGDNEPFAVQMYHGSTVKDGYPGTYPPDDTGSSGLGACRFLKGLHLITSYTHALSARGIGVLMQRGGTIQGWPWYNAWFEPDAQGFVDHGSWQKSGLAGGHEIFCEAIEAWDDNDLSKCVLRFRNSWGASWADHGSFRLRLSTYEMLKSQVDVKQFQISA